MSWDRCSGVFWLILSLAILYESTRLGIGTPRSPGAGFISFGASGVLALLSLGLLVQTVIGRKTEAENLFKGKLWHRVGLSALALFAYAWVMPAAGYLVTTFVLMVLLYWLVRGKASWWSVLVCALLTTFGSYYLFSKLLNCQFPVGLFAF